MTSLAGNRPLSANLDKDAQEAIELAARLLEKAHQLQTPQERRQQAELDRMIGHVEDKATLVEMTDQAFRTHSPARVADQLVHLLDVQGVPRFFSPVEQAMLRGFQSFGEYLPGVAVPLVKEKMRRETANVILPAEPAVLAEHLRNRQQHDVQMNVNLLGEAILGEAEARRRIKQCYDALRMPEVRCLSVKISTLYSQISTIARKHTTNKVADRLESLYRIATDEIDPQTGMGKFVYLDMEEYRDLYLTTDILCDTLEREDMQQVRAGVALQAYVPDSYAVMRRLIDWSRERVAAGGLPLTIRLVKGANMEMECVDASIHGYPQAPYSNKIETDANFKRMLSELIDAAQEKIVRVGIASHNLFDVALGLIWARQRQAIDFVQFEMLEGMANHQRRALTEESLEMLLYAPACFRDGFLNAVGYLIRRLDENTGPENFLRHTYKLRSDTDEFRMLADGFRQSFRRAAELCADEIASQQSGETSLEARRKQDRRQMPMQPDAPEHWRDFVNEPDTDWSLPHNADWIESVLQRWSVRGDAQATEVPLQIGETVLPISEVAPQQSIDPSRPGVVVCRYRAATPEELNQAVAIAAADAEGWSTTSLEDRHRLLRQAAQRLRQRRGDLIGAMVADGGKTVAEADPEVSEAIDFCEFYPLTVKHWAAFPGIRLEPRGVVAVVSPWNFPLAIACGGIAASLAAGNRVILKPSSETVLIASLLCQAFWDAGVPKTALQMIPCAGKTAEAGLIRNPSVETVILTGGTSTARRMLSVRNDLHLLAETGGKNATIVTAMADRELAIKHVVQSAFGHSGQKCSATSLLLLEDEVFDDQRFQQMLADAVESIRVGSSWDLSTRMGPLIHPPTAELNRGLKTLDANESWLVVPEHLVENPCLYRPGVKWDIRPGSFTHLTELFGPVLGVMRFSRLEQAIEIVRSTGYGLTSGIESLDRREIELWRDTVHAGNLYINRVTTGAIVLRQPFGGVGLSAYGPGVKAGGPHYVLTLMKVHNDPSRLDQETAGSIAEHTTDVEFNQLSQWLDNAIQRGMLEQNAFGKNVSEPSPVQRLSLAIKSQYQAYASEFSRQHDTFCLVGQDNLRRYRPVDSLCIRFNSNDSFADLLVALFAAIAVKAPATVSIDPAATPEQIAILDALADVLPRYVHPVEESSQALAERILNRQVGRLRVLTSTSESVSVAQRQRDAEIMQACADAFVTVVREAVIDRGRIECLRYLEEQSISHDYHRYGNLGRRAMNVNQANVNRGNVNRGNVNRGNVNRGNVNRGNVE